jgi:hypothetical protein
VGGEVGQETHTDMFEQVHVSTWHNGGTERTEPSSRRLVVDMGELGKCAWFLIVEVLRALGKGGVLAWVEQHPRSLPTTFQCDGRESGVVSPDILSHPAIYQCTGMYLHSGALLRRQRNELLSVPSASYQKVHS